MSDTQDDAATYGLAMVLIQGRIPIDKELSDTQADILLENALVLARRILKRNPMLGHPDSAKVKPS